MKIFSLNHNNSFNEYCSKKKKKGKKLNNFRILNFRRVKNEIVRLVARTVARAMCVETREEQKI